MLALVSLEVYQEVKNLYVPAWLLEAPALGSLGVCSSAWGGRRTVKVNMGASSHEVCGRACLFLLQ